jgi:hypothetical protein
MSARQLLVLCVIAETLTRVRPLMLRPHTAAVQQQQQQRRRWRPSQPTPLRASAATLLDGGATAAPTSERSVQADLMNDVRNVAIPSFVAYIVEPLLSLVDAFFVGRFSVAGGTLGLAGMGINGAVFNVIAAATSPLSTGTTAVISKLRGEDEEQHGEHAVSPRMNARFLNALALSATVGTLISAAILLAGRPFLRAAFDIRDPAFLATSSSYLLVRGLSLPSVLINLVVFGFSIAVSDVLAPVLSIAAAFVVNVVGDWLMCAVLGTGLVGAAVATTLSSYAGSLLALRYLFRKYPLQVPRRGGGVAWGQLFDRTGFQAFAAACGPMVVGQLANTLTYSTGARITGIASAGAVHQIAAHQLVMGSWWFLSFFSSPVFLLSTALLPMDLAARRTDRIRLFLRFLAKCAWAVAAFTTAINAALLLGAPTLFTKDVAVSALLPTVVWQSCSSLCLICLATVLDGLFLGAGRLGDYVAASVASTAAAWGYYALVAIPRAQGLIGTWNGLLLFSVVRSAYYASKLRGLTRDVTTTT